MRLLKKIALTVAGSLLAVVILLSLFVALRRDSLIEAVTRKINETVNTRISYRDIRVTFLSSFPNVSVKLTDLLVRPSPYYDVTQFPSDNNDTLLFASSLSLSAHIPSLLKGTVALRSITLKDGTAVLLTDKRGGINWEVMEESGGGGKAVKLNNISIRNLKTVWNDRSSSLRISGVVEEATVGGEIFRNGIFLNCSLGAKIDSVDIHGLKFPGLPAKADLRVRKTSSSLSIAKGSLDLGGLAFAIDGGVNYSTSSVDLAIEGKKISVSTLVSSLPSQWKAAGGSFNPSGIIDLKCTLSGPYGKNGSPALDLNYSLSGGRMSHQVTGISVNDLSFSGIVRARDLSNPDTYFLSVDTLNATYGDASLAASFILSNLRKPRVRLAAEGNINFDDLRKALGTELVKSRSGSVRGKVKLSGQLPDSMRFTLASLPSLNPEATLVFNNFTGSLSPVRHELSDMTGSLTLTGNLKASDLAFTYLGQRFTVNASFEQFTEWVSGRPVTMSIEGDVRADRFITGLFTGTTAGQDGSEVKSGGDGIFPNDVTADVTLHCDSIISQGFRASDFSSRMTYRPFLYTFSNISARGLDGTLSGEFALGLQQGGSYISKSRLSVRMIDLEKTFRSFNNFGQSFITYDNLKGKLTGDVTVMTPLDAGFRVMTGSLVAEAHLSIANGRLVSFAPAESLSAFLDLDELRDISFSGMENDIYIRNRTVSLPKMLINSSAGNFTVYGSHGFDGDYVYHVRVLLSEVMSRKARDRNRDEAAFGQVKVDDSGKATIPIRIECTGGETTVVYDFGQAQQNIRENYAEEKKTLKSILNEEYGWYSKDTTAMPALEEKKPKFSVTWEEGKGQPAQAQPAEKEPSESPLNIFKKKKK